MKKFKDNIKLVDNIPDWPGYHVTPEGEVWSRHKMVRYSFVLENHSRSKLTNYQRIRIIYLYKNKGFTYRQLAEKFNVFVGCISSVIKNPNCIKLYEKKYQ